MNSRKKYRVIGMMSGTSLDGVDICFATFINYNGWSYQIHAAETVSYSRKMTEVLTKAPYLSGRELVEMDFAYGEYLGKLAKGFIKENQLSNIDFIASHGHTIFHQPERNITLQIGNGQAISHETGYPVIYDFRSKDVLLGGNGAPLVPIGDHLLFGEFDYCLNLGGIANISFEKNKNRIAFDICPCNLILNYEAIKLGYPYDKDGLIASKGEIIKELLIDLNSLNYYKMKNPKSLGREWVENNFISRYKNSNFKTENLLRTLTEHIAIQISNVLVSNVRNSMLITGGGAFNTFLIKRISELSDVKIHILSDQITNYKEALIFSFLGVLRWRNEINVLSSVTGAERDSCSGVLVPG